jgi:5-methyltetrahydropteroyltriglutamate--homocysteine methyltransferase
VVLRREADVRTATDGEFRRTSWHMDFIYQLEVVDPVARPFDFEDAGDSR